MCGTKHPGPCKAKAVSVPRKHMHPSCRTLVMAGGRGEYEDQDLTPTEQSPTKLQGSPHLVCRSHADCCSWPTGPTTCGKADLHSKSCR